MSENRSDNTPGPSSRDEAPWQSQPAGGGQSGGGASDPDQPSPFSREGADGQEVPGGPNGSSPDGFSTSGASAGGSSALDPSDSPTSPADPSSPASTASPAEPSAPQSWPGYPASAPEASYHPLSDAPEQPGPAPYGSPSAPDQGYGQPPAAYGQVGAYGSNPYDPAPNPYQPSYGGYSPYGVGPVQHPKATPALIFGIIGLVLSFSCGIGGLLGIGGIVNGRRAKQEIDADPQRYLGRGMASAGFGLGLAGTIIGSLVVVIFIIAGLSGAFDI